ncbi:uncharacterized protein [Clytia hemisphaerica]|uniref:PA14 domain-containing protein n=1 Tax=Clytia hemisphaerica TaxID=252671 RepID=A0A7M6DNC4_9CNID|eukprot:TCONS_00004736-protein
MMEFKLVPVLYVICTIGILIKTIATHNIVRLPKTNEAIFSLRKKNKRIATTAYKTFEVNELFDCADACVYDTSCKSINVDKSNQPWVCELVADDRNTKNEYVDAPGVNHYDTGWTTLTIITNHDQTACLMSSSRHCEFDAGYNNYNVRIETDMTICNSHRAAIFHFDRRIGRLVHHCTGYPVGHQASDGLMKIYKTGYPSDMLQNIDYYLTAWRRDFRGYLFFGNNCTYVGINGWREGDAVYLSDACSGFTNARVFYFRSIDNGPVKVTAITGLTSSDRSWNSYIGQSKFPNNPDWSGYQDDFMSYHMFWQDQYGMRFEALFIPPSTGNYKFRIYCDDICEFNLGESEDTKTRIINYKTLSRTQKWLTYKYPGQNSNSFHHLIKHKEYYIELLFREFVGADHAEITFFDPDRQEWILMTSRFLRKAK